MKVWTFEQISNVLKVAGEKKCQEAQACLEGMRIVFFNGLFQKKSAPPDGWGRFLTPPLTWIS